MEINQIFRHAAQNRPRSICRCLITFTAQSTLLRARYVLQVERTKLHWSWTKTNNLLESARLISIPILLFSTVQKVRQVDGGSKRARAWWRQIGGHLYVENRFCMDVSRPAVRKKPTHSQCVLGTETDKNTRWFWRADWNVTLLFKPLKVKYISICGWG